MDWLPLALFRIVAKALRRHPEALILITLMTVASAAMAAGVAPWPMMVMACALYTLYIILQVATQWHKERASQ